MTSITQERAGKGIRVRTARFFGVDSIVFVDHDSPCNERICEAVGDSPRVVEEWEEWSQTSEGTPGAVPDDECFGIFWHWRGVVCVQHRDTNQCHRFHPGHFIHFVDAE